MGQAFGEAYISTSFLVRESPQTFNPRNVIFAKNRFWKCEVKMVTSVSQILGHLYPLLLYIVIFMNHFFLLQNGKLGEDINLIHFFTRTEDTGMLNH